MASAMSRREKAAQVAVFFASRGIRDLTTLKLVKLIYFADKRHLHLYGRTITGDRYFGMENGPVPSDTYDALKTGAFATVLMSERAECGEHPVWRAIASLDRDLLSESDEEVMEDVAQRYGAFTASALRNLAHREPDYKRAEARLVESGRGSVPIPTEDMVIGVPPAEAEALAAILAEETENDLLSASL